MKKLNIALIAAVVLLLVSSCTDNVRARQFGGTSYIDVTRGQKVIGVTFKENNIWILTRPAKAGEVAEVIEFIEHSNFGVLNGKVILKEKL